MEQKYQFSGTSVPFTILIISELRRRPQMRRGSMCPGELRGRDGVYAFAGMQVPYSFFISRSFTSEEMAAISWSNGPTGQNARTARTYQGLLVNPKDAEVSVKSTRAPSAQI